MTVSPLPSHVVAFVRDNIRSLLQLESLLLVFEGRERPRTAADLSAEMYVPVEALTSWLDEFAQKGFCTRNGDTYCGPEDPSTYRLLTQVAEAYLRRPVSVGRLVFGASRDDLVELSDAFRLRKDRG